MKKLLLLTVCALVLAACSSEPKRVGINAVPAKLTAAIEKADKACNTSADCTTVNKGCCMCAGYAAVNKDAAEKVKKVWDKACQMAPCTREMCMVETGAICQNHTCQAVRKPVNRGPAL